MKVAFADKPEWRAVSAPLQFILPQQESGGWCVSTCNPSVMLAY